MARKITKNDVAYFVWVRARYTMLPIDCSQFAFMLIYAMHHNTLNIDAMIQHK